MKKWLLLKKYSNTQIKINGTVPLYDRTSGSSIMYQYEKVIWVSNLRTTNIELAMEKVGISDTWWGEKKEKRVL